MSNEQLQVLELAPVATMAGKIDNDKIKTLDDVIMILSLLEITVDDTHPLFNDIAYLLEDTYGI